MELIDWISKWYIDNCDGDWEHTSGVLIETLDNPGWSIKIDLINTPLEGKQLAEVFVDKSEDDWLKICSDGKRFIGYGDANKLKHLIESFKSFSQL
ncbi:hypothetical protein HDE69_001176 [Pedobacter cryoconitis]|uniref:Immunity protein 53 of polymorphic toxin system n=1 Tax=Pedobacter cryoconitis TaxID=188932 RepID=A0A7W9DIH5_9SPHI|nr:immunity 53 family protein [Pedobacter cryoconitis]MBB5620138.1 hypothetical protein [Pedobacter cryoconitis]MBB5649158.1 hypothetical protein [Pedobacter cryoconitis]